MKEEMCLLDSCTTNYILKETKYFQTLTRRTGNILSIARHDTNIVGSNRATMILSMGTQLHVTTHEENNEVFLHIIKKNGDGHDILERIPFLPYEFYYIYIKLIPHVMSKVIFQNVDAFMTWHEHHGHPRLGMMKKILGNSIGHNLSATKFPRSSDFVCTACATGKLILRPSPLKIQVDPLTFLERIQGDICGPIQPLLGPFMYFMVSIDAFTW
jgi:hypothetical protein